MELVLDSGWEPLWWECQMAQRIQRVSLWAKESATVWGRDWSWVAVTVGLTRWVVGWMAWKMVASLVPRKDEGRAGWKAKEPWMALP